MWHYARRGWAARLTALDVAVQLRRRVRFMDDLREKAKQAPLPAPEAAWAQVDISVFDEAP